MEKILITGGAGYIGSHTAAEMAAAGYDFAIVDNLCNSRRGVIERLAGITGAMVEFGQIDLLDRDGLADFVATTGPYYGVIHFAAFKSVGASVKDPLAYYRNNIGSMVNICDVMKESGISNIVFSSSCTVYGQPESLPVKEDAPFLPATSPYGQTKQVSEHILRDITSVSDLSAVSLRYFNPIGAHPSARIGELPLSVPDNLVPYITQTAAGLRERLTVHGNDYDTPDGTAVRDYIHVMDLARAHVRAMDYLRSRKGTGYSAFNLGTGKGCSVLEVINAFERVSAISLPWEYGPRRPGDVERIWADPSLANMELGWKAEMDLEQMVSSAWEWQQAYQSEPIT